MKRMSDVFELPLSGEESQGEPFLSDSTYYFASFDDEMTFEDGKGLERAQHAAHAINHVDALADALELLLSDKAMIHIGNDKHLQAKAALAGYRGEA
jgi:hypothetical protein